jgi:hypothetical protein
MMETVVAFGVDQSLFRWYDCSVYTIALVALGLISLENPMNFLHVHEERSLTSLESPPTLVAAISEGLMG